MLEAGYAPLPPKLDVHTHCHPALLPHCQQLSQFHHLLLHGHKVRSPGNSTSVKILCFRFRRVLFISVKSIFVSDVTAVDIFEEESETEMMIWRRIR